MDMKNHPFRRLFVSGGIAVALFGAAGTALAEESEPTEDPLGGLRTELCDQVRLLQPTSTCAVYDPATETSTNPYTPNGDSPGILGLGFLGLL